MDAIALLVFGYNILDMFLSANPPDPRRGLLIYIRSQALLIAFRPAGSYIGLQIWNIATYCSTRLDSAYSAYFPIGIPTS